MSLDVNKFLIEEIKYFVIMPIVMLYICDEINSRTASDFSVAFILWMCWYSFYPLISSIRIHTKPKQPLP
ncbi:MAG TPA: hypothetical protein PK211_10410, partial [Agitococcus sp.]|nr:hypothetical protein [Agitococcus sp.]